MAVVPGLTLEEFLSLPETEPASEYVDGEVIQKVAPEFQHSALQGSFAGWINAVTCPRKLGIAFPELRCVLEGRSYVPDNSYVKAERLPLDSQGWLLPGNLNGAPDVAIEILSPGQRLNVVNQKLLFLLDHGCQLGLLVDPLDRSVGVFRPGKPFERLVGRDVLRLAEVADDLNITVEALFGMLRWGA